MGRGLSALLNENTEKIISAKDEGAEELIKQIVEIPIEKIKANPNQPRTHFEPHALQELAQSIKELGVIQPITVRKQKDYYEIISGERRYRASGIAGLERIPAFVRLANDQEMLEMALVENIQREDLDAIEIALTYQRLINEINLTQEALSERVGKNRSTVTNYLRLLKLDPIIQTGIRDGMITMGHGRALMGIEDLTDQMDVYEKIIANGLSVRQTEILVKNLNTPKKDKISLPNDFKIAQKHLEDTLKTKVEIKRNAKGKGKIVLNFNSDDDFQRIKKLLE